MTCSLRYCIMLWWTPDHCLNEIESRREARKSWTISEIPARFCEEVRYASLLISVVTTALLGQFPNVFPYVHLKQSGHKKSSKTLSEHKILTPTPPPPPPSRYGITKSQAFLCLVALWVHNVFEAHIQQDTQLGFVGNRLGSFSFS